MAPTSGRGKTTRKASKPSPRRSSYTKKLVKADKINTQTTSRELCSEMDGLDHIHSEGVDYMASASPCSTPKAQRFRIAENMDICPPAPKKPRSLPSNYSLPTTPIAFFAPPDIEMFFFCAFRDISV
ncbi:hypothetical protein V6N13_119183 [Hibiscus sabdariffa]|uniref:Uncharacterized protein n=1 Tax=Hibiscus sabdariffa TaxID=183260 RepID=A0ABR2E0I9_9ROSI